MTKEILVLAIMIIPSLANSQRGTNYDEDAIPDYTLPSILRMENGDPVQDIQAWQEKRRPQILGNYENLIYGKIPGMPLSPLLVQVVEQDDNALDGMAIRRQVRVTFQKNGRSLPVHLLMYVPKSVPAPPTFVGYNFFGNHTIIKDDAVVLTTAWTANRKSFGIENNQATETSRGVRAYRWPVEKIIKNGFALVTLYYGEIDPDKNDFQDGIHPFFYTDGQQQPKPGEWGSIAAWAWGYSRVLDYLKGDSELSNSRFILFGHSRLGKTALWAGALDDRFDIVVSNNSGCGGAALFNRKFGETVAKINDRFPHWFAANFKQFNDKEENLPLDQHMLIALIAPRPVYIASAAEDQWADPKGEYLSAYYASPVYELYGKTGLTTPNLAPLNQPIHNTIGYHLRTGKHDVTDYDWQQFMEFAQKHFNR